jgi:hypothetical protein
MSKKMLQAAAGNAGGDNLYVEDVFSTYLYAGNDNVAFDITNNIDLAGEGGLVWIKVRDASFDHNIFDTERGANEWLETNTTLGEQTATNKVDAFNADGFSLGTNSAVNGGTDKNYVSWTFRKAEKFFDVVTFSGSAAPTTISHNLGVVPGMIIVKRTSATSAWWVWHTSIPNNALALNTTQDTSTFNAPQYVYGDGVSVIQPTDADFTIYTGNSGTYVAYLFAHTPTSNFVQESFSASYFADGASPVSVNGPDGSGEYVMYTNTSIGNTYAKIAGVLYSVSGTNNWGGISDVIFAATGSRYKQGAYEYTNGGIAPHYQVDYYSQYSGPVYEDEESFIVCGSVSYNGGATVDLGFEPQWVLVKTSNATGNWVINDNMRGMPNGSRGPRLDADTSNAEFANATVVYPTATGFIMPAGLYDPVDLIYIAIRRPMKTPESGTEVFKTIEQNWSTGILDAGFPVDLAIFQTTDAGNNGRAVDRLRGKTKLLYPNGPSAESGESYYALDNNEGFELVSSPVSNNWVWWLFKRATGFFDVVAYTGNGTAGRTVAHNLGVVPELMIVKQRPYTSSWTVYNKDIGAANKLVLDSTAALASATSAWNSTAPTATVFTLGSLNDTNENPLAFIAYLFATVAGVSKVGSYTGTGADLNVDCGFSAGARFILIKRADSTGDWYVYDSVRGIVAGNDPYLLLNSDVAEVTSTDYIDPLSSGFTVTSSAPAALNASGGIYIFLAIA